MSFQPPMDLTGPMLEQRRVMISGALDSTAVSQAAALLMLLDGQSDEPVTVVVNSGGGRLEDAVGLHDTLALMRAPLTVDVIGRAHGSAGVVVAAAPGARRLGATASISLHLEPSATPNAGSADELAVIARAQQELRRRLATVVGTRTGQTIDWVLDQFERGTTWFGGDARDAGLVDELR